MTLSLLTQYHRNVSEKIVAVVVGAQYYVLQTEHAVELHCSSTQMIIRAPGKVRFSG